MGQIEDLRLFTIIVEQGSISQAADALNIAKSAVSRRLNLLEQRYGTRLITRDRGNWEISATGRELYQRAVGVVSDVDEIEGDFTEEVQSLAGPLSVSVPREFGLSFLNKSLMAFKVRYPDIQLSVDFDDHMVDLSRDNYDFAIRITTEIGSGVVARRIGGTERRVFASQAYLSRRGRPSSLQDLENHDLLQFGSTKRSSWLFHDSKGKPQSLEFQPSLNSNSGIFLLEATLAGLGIARIPDFICQTAVDSGALIPILTDLASPELGIYLVHSEDRRLNRRMRLFADQMVMTCTQADHSA